LEFIFTLIKNINNNFPKAIFIIAGFNYQNIRHWHTDLKFTTQVYEIEDIKVEDIQTCLSHIFSKYKEKIKQIDGFDDITEQEYVEGMIGKLIQDGEQIKISDIGLNISEHLYALKS